MIWWKEIALLKQELEAVRSELENEQGKAARLAGFMGRLLAFRISPVGQTPHQAFGDALLDAAHVLLKAEQAVLFCANKRSVTICLANVARIPSREIVPAGTISPLFSPRIGSPQHRRPKLRVCVFGNEKGWLFVVGRVRFLVKPACFANR